MFGKTLETVLAERPCRVIIESRPPARRQTRAPRGPAAGDRMSPVTLLLSGVMVLLGVAIIVRTVAAGGGPLAYGVVLGLLFVAAGAGRLWVERRR